MSPLFRHVCTAFLATALPGLATAQPVEPVLALAKKERQPLLDTLKELVSIETGSRDLEGLDRAADLIAERLRALGGKVELVDPTADAYRMEDTPAKIGKIQTSVGTRIKRMPKLRAIAKRIKLMRFCLG